MLSQSRLTSPTDDATQHPINVAVSSQLSVLAEYDDGSEDDMSTDSRVGYSTSDAGCATVGASAAAISLRILPDAVCTSVVIVATVQLEQPLPLSSGRRLDST